MDKFTSLPDIFLESLQALFIKIVAYTPNIIAALLLVIVGYLVARLIAFIITSLCNQIGLNKLSAKVGISNVLEKSGVKRSFSSIIGTIIFWMIMLTFLVSSANTLGLDRVSTTIDSFILYLPKVIAAALVLLVGLFVSSFFKNAIKTSTSHMNVEYGQVLSQTAYSLLVVVSIVLAVSQLDIDVTLIVRIISIALLAIAVAVMLSLGLGTREISSNVMSGIYLRDLYKVGSTIEVGELRGEVIEVGSTKTLIKAGDNYHSISNVELMSSVVTISK